MERLLKVEGAGKPESPLEDRVPPAIFTEGLYREEGSFIVLSHIRDLCACEHVCVCICVWGSHPALNALNRQVAPLTPQGRGSLYCHSKS